MLTNPWLFSSRRSIKRVARSDCSARPGRCSGPAHWRRVRSLQGPVGDRVSDGRLHLLDGDRPHGRGDASLHCRHGPRGRDQFVEGVTSRSPGRLAAGQRGGEALGVRPRQRQLPWLKDCRRRGKAQLHGLSRDCGGQALQRWNRPGRRLDTVALVALGIQDGQQSVERPFHQRSARRRLNELGGQRTGRALQCHRDAVGGAQLRQMQGDRCGDLLGRRSGGIVVEEPAGDGGSRRLAARPAPQARMGGQGHRPPAHPG